MPEEIGARAETRTCTTRRCGPTRRSPRCRARRSRSAATDRARAGVRAVHRPVKPGTQDRDVGVDGSVERRARREVVAAALEPVAHCRVVHRPSLRAASARARVGRFAAHPTRRLRRRSQRAQRAQRANAGRLVNLAPDADDRLRRAPRARPPRRGARPGHADPRARGAGTRRTYRRRDPAWALGPIKGPTTHGHDPVLRVHTRDYVEFLETAYDEFGARHRRRARNRGDRVRACPSAARR